MPHPPFRDIDIGLYSVSSTADNRAAALRAEARGFRRVWLAEDHHSRDIFVQATAVGVATERIGIGLGIVNPYTRHPAQIAMAMADGVFFSVLASPAYVEHCLGHAQAGLAAAGLGTPVLYQVLGPDRLASIDLIAERIRPALAE